MIVKEKAKLRRGLWWDVFLKDRVAGKSRAEARANYVKQIRESSEWRTKHPGETP